MFFPYPGIVNTLICSTLDITGLPDLLVQLNPLTSAVIFSLEHISRRLTYDVFILFQN